MDPLLIVALIVVGLLVLLALFYGRLRRRRVDREAWADIMPASPPASQLPDSIDVMSRGEKEKKRDADDVDADDSFIGEEAIAPTQQSFGEVGAELPSVVSDEMSERDKEEIAADDLPRDYFPAMESADEESDEVGEEWDNWSVEGSSGRGIAEKSAEEAEEDIAFAAAPEPEPPPPPAPEPKRRKRQESEAEEAAESVPGLSRGFDSSSPDGFGFVAPSASPAPAADDFTGAEPPPSPSEPQKSAKTEIHQSAEDAEQVTQIGVVEGDVNITYESPKADTQFAAYYPEQIAPDEWQPLYAYVYNITATEQVMGDAMARQREHRDIEFGVEVEPARVAVPKGTTITARLKLPGFEVEAPDPLIFYKDWHRLDFRVKAAAALLDKTVTGHLAFEADGVPVADVFFEIGVGEFVPAEVERKRATARVHEALYCSYSDADYTIGERVKAICEMMGIAYLRPQSGQGRDDLSALIGQADVFQLLWSAAAAESPDVAQEWQLALERAREEAAFLRPVYWEQPKPPVPVELADFYFDYKPQLAG